MGDKRARGLAEQLLAATLPQRWTHVQAVAATATHICEALDLEPELAVSAAWLHDIGYAPDVVATGFHPLDGARYLVALGWDKRVCGLVAHHTDAASQAHMVGLATPLLAEFADVRGLSRDILWTADATTGPGGEAMELDERVTEVSERYGASHPATVAMIASQGALAAAISRVRRALEEVRAHA